MLFFRVVALSMSPINDSFLSGSLDKTLRLWDLRSQNCQVRSTCIEISDFHILHLNVKPVIFMAFYPLPLTSKCIIMY